MVYRVYLTSTGRISAFTDVSADSLQDAAELAITEAQEGKILWNYDGCDDENIEVENVWERSVQTDEELFPD